MRCDTSVLTENLLQSLIQYLPTPDQLNKLQVHKITLLNGNKKTPLYFSVVPLESFIWLSLFFSFVWNHFLEFVFIFIKSKSYRSIFFNSQWLMYVLCFSIPLPKIMINIEIIWLWTIFRSTVMNTRIWQKLNNLQSVLQTLRGMKNKTMN